MNKTLPPGQYDSEEFPRFGLPEFANRFPDRPHDLTIEITDPANTSLWRANESNALKRVSQSCDFHCVTTWTKRGLSWSGFRFSEFYEKTVSPALPPEPDINYVIFRCQDGFRARMLLTDLLAVDVLLADRFDDRPLSVAHGAPLRLIAPAHYGYKSAKHIKGIDFCHDDHSYKAPLFDFMDHPRARVEHEERGKYFPAPVFRWLYRPSINRVQRKFRNALLSHQTNT